MWQVSDFEIDLANRRLWRNREMLSLTERDFDFIAVLVKRGEISREEAAGIYHQPDFKYVYKQISDLRARLRDRTRPYRLIQTMRDRGYRLAQRAQEIPDNYSRAISDVTEPAVPQVTLWAPVFGGPPGIFINRVGGKLILWKELQQEILEGLFPQAVRCIAKGSTVALLPLRDQPNFRIGIVSPSEKIVGRVWFGADPKRGWRFDGKVRIGTTRGLYFAEVWQIYTRYSDGSYRLWNAIY